MQHFLRLVFFFRPETSLWGRVREINVSVSNRWCVHCLINSFLVRGKGRNCSLDNIIWIALNKITRRNFRMKRGGELYFSSQVRTNFCLVHLQIFVDKQSRFPRCCTEIGKFALYCNTNHPLETWLSWYLCRRINGVILMLHLKDSQLSIMWMCSDLLFFWRSRLRPKQFSDIFSTLIVAYTKERGFLLLLSAVFNFRSFFFLWVQ